MKEDVQRLCAKLAEADAEAESLRDTVAHLGESLANALADGACAGAAAPNESGRQGWSGAAGRRGEHAGMQREQHSIGETVCRAV